MGPGMLSAKVAGHLGELLQGRLGPEGRVALITLPAPRLFVEAKRGAGAFQLHQPSALAITRAELAELHRALRVPPQGKWVIRAEMPVAAGAGASTAVRLAVAQILRPNLPRMALERLLLKLERASDPLLAPQPERVLWASREGRVLAQMPPLPRLQVVGGFLPGRVQTDPNFKDFPNITQVVNAWGPACSDPRALGQLVRQNAELRLAQLGQDGAWLEQLAQSVGAFGWGIAHTGTARFWLLPAQSPQAAPLASELKRRGLSHVQNYQIGER